MDAVIAERIVRALQSHIDTLQAVYIFGSQADGTANEMSDIDIAYLSKSPLSSVERFTLSQELARLLDRDVDLIALSETNTIFRYQIIAKGVRIYGDSNDVDAFETLAFSFYLRFQEERQSIVDAIYKDARVLDVS